MLMTSLHQRQRKRTQLIVIISICSMIFLGCSKGNVESPNDSNNIWGFGEIVENKSNTFQSNTAIIADTESFNYWNRNDFFQKVQDSLTTQYQGIYQSNYQQEALGQIVKLKESRTYSTDHPLLIHNPFGTNSSSLYVYFGALTQRIVLYYTVSAADETIPDFSDTMYINFTNTNEIEGQIVGLISGQQNKVVLDIRDDAGNKLGKKAYIIDVPEKKSGVEQRLTSETNGDVEYTRGLFTYLVEEDSSCYFVFYDNNGILRSEIPIYVKQPNARILQAGNQIFYEYSDNMFVLVNNLGHIVQTYSYESGDNVIDYDYDASKRIVLVIVEDTITKARDKVMALNLETGEWSTLVEFKKLMHNYMKDIVMVEGEEQNQNDWLDLNYIYIVDEKDIIVLAKKVNSILRVNNVYSQPVIRWIIGNENQWKNTDYESLLLAHSGKDTDFEIIDSLTYSSSKKLKDQQLYLSFIHSNIDQQTSNAVRFGKYLVDENQNKYRIQQSLEIPSNQSDCSAVGYGTHTVIALWNQKIIVEYNQKGEIMLKMILPSTSSSYRIYKYTMDRYWF